MRHRGLLFLAAFLLTAAAPEPVDDLAAISRGEDAFGQAFVTGDTAALERILDDGFVGVGPAGSYYSKAEAIAAARALPHTSFDLVEQLKVRFYGETAIAQGHEVERGPGPEFKPLRRVFTDTWVKRGGVWKVVAAEDLDPGAPTSAAHQADRDAITALRARSNAAIRAHDMAAFTPVFAEDAVFVWSNGTSAVGRGGLESFFARDFADPAFIAYVRTPERVAVSENGLRAVEHGTWTALKANGAGPTRYGGDYAAHWFKGAAGWQIRGELYVKLRCEGSLCTP